jgi:hypothetical protein
VAGEAESPFANRIDNGTMMLVVGDNERNGDTCIDQGFVFGTPHD